MAVCFVEFMRDKQTIPYRDVSKDIGLRVGKATYRSIIDSMALFPANSFSAQEWREYLNYISCWNMLYVGKENVDPKQQWDNGPSFLLSLLELKENGPPEYYPKKDLNKLRSELDKLFELIEIYRKDLVNFS